MSDFANTTDLLGDDYVCDGIITKTLIEYADDHVNSIGNYVFYVCSSLTKVDIPNSADIGVYAFYGCSKLTSVSAPVVVSVGNYAFYNCYELTAINIPQAVSIEKSAFRYCYVLETIDLPAVTSIGTYTFYGCTKLTTVIIRSDIMCTLSDTNAFASTPIADGTGYIYVPSALVEEYSLATNWADYSTQFRAIEDYTDITGG